MHFVYLLMLGLSMLGLSCRSRTIGDVTMATAMNQDTIWTRTYGGAYEDEARAIQQTRDGGFIIAGFTKSFGGHDIYLVKTDAEGKTVWTRTYGSLLKSEANSLCQTEDGGFAICGFMHVPWLGSTVDRMYLIKVNAFGDTAWTRILGIDGGEANVVLSTDDGGLLLVGSMFKEEVVEKTRRWGERSEFDTVRSSQSYPCIVRVDSMGNELWKRYYERDGNWVASAQYAKDGGLVFAGVRKPALDAKYQVFAGVVVRTGNNYEKIWDCTLQPTKYVRYVGETPDNRSDTTWFGFGGAFAICQVSDGGFVVACGRHLGIVRISRVGETLWTRAINIEARSICTVSGDTLIASGFVPEPAGASDMVVLKVTPDGKVVHTWTLGGRGDDKANAMCKTADGNLLIVGYTNSFGAGDKDFYVVKIRL